MWRAFRKSERGQCSRTRDALSGYVDRRLGSEETARVETHLSTCQGCREELESLRATVALLHGLPEVTPSRSFAVALAKPLPGRTVWSALRFATAAVVLLLAAVFAVDWTGVLERAEPADAGVYYGPSAAAVETDVDHWWVPGLKNDIIDSDNFVTSPVNLVVPDGSDNLSAAVVSLSGDGVVYAALEADPGGVPQLVLARDEYAVSGGDLKEFAVVAKPEPDGDTRPFAPSGPAKMSAIESILSDQDGEFLNIVPANSDNTVVYAFNLSKSVPAETRTVPNGDSAANGWSLAFGSSDEAWWLRPLEYGLIGLVAVFGGATAVLWLKRRRARTVAAGYDKT